MDLKNMISDALKLVEATDLKLISFLRTGKRVIINN
jgi:hypothetical protein